MSDIKNSTLLWLDLETSGSEVEQGDEIIDIGCVLTDSNLEEISSFESIVYPSPLALGRLYSNDIVRKMHTHNGLLDGLLYIDPEDRNHFKIHNVTKRLLEWLIDSGAPKGKTVICGSGVSHFDLPFLKRYCPQIVPGYCRYWTLDIGVVRRMHEIFDLQDPPKHHNDDKTHIGIDDARCHLEEARMFKDFWNKTQDGWIW